jgi:hypothetical protein
MQLLHFSVADNPEATKVAHSTIEVAPSGHVGSRIAARDRSYLDVHVYPLRYGIEAPVQRPRLWYICMLRCANRSNPAVRFGSGSAGPVIPTFSILGE